MRLLFATVVVSACSDGAPGSKAAADAPRTTATLVEMSAWTPGTADVAADPLEDHRPSSAECPPGTALMEGASFEVKTGTCTYGWFQQPALTDLQPGDLVELVFWHSPLVSDPPAEGHVALFVGDRMLHEQWVTSPQMRPPTPSPRSRTSRRMPVRSSRYTSTIMA